MKTLNDPDFNPFDFFSSWSELSYSTRLLFVTEIGSSLDVLESVFSPEQSTELIDAGFQLPHRPVLEPTARPFRNLIRSMYRHPHFAPSTTELDLDYVTDHLINSESSGISVSDRYMFRSKPSQTAKATAVDSSWLNAFLNADSFKEWEGRYDDGQHRYLDEPSAALLKRWIERLRDGENPIPISALLEDVGHKDHSAQKALRAGVRYLLLFPALDPKTLDPLIGIWPAIHVRMNRKTRIAPAPVDLPEGCEIYRVPILLHDMTTLLIGTTGEGLRLKAQGDLYKKEENALALRLMSVPPSGCGSQPPRYGRLYQARLWLLGMKFVASKGKAGKTLALKATSTGMQWLSGSEGARLQTLADFMRKAHKRNVSGKSSEYYDIEFVPGNPQHYPREGNINLEEKVIEAFSICPVGQWISIQEFLTWHMETRNPLFLSFDQTLEKIFSYAYRDNSDAGREHLWKKVLQDFFQQRLIPLGGIKTGFDLNGNLWFSITPVGAYLLGATDVFEYETEAIEGDIIIQPNFDIVFTAINPFAEGELARYAERIGHGIGTLFRITRASVHLAFNSGMEGDQILESLQPLVSKKLPANVVAQIRDWGRSFRRVAIKNVTIIRCPDADTALRIHALFPQKTDFLTETLLQISNPKDLAPLKKKLCQNGIGIE